MTETRTTSRYFKLAQLVAAGFSREEVMAKLDISKAHYHGDLSRARAAGFLPPFEAKAVVYAAPFGRWRASGKLMGKMQDVVDALTIEQVDWLVDQLPEGSTLAEFVVAVLTDVYEEENSS